MPKEGPGAEEWAKRLRDYAKGKKLGKGQAPRPGTVYHKQYVAITMCPITSRGRGQLNLTGQTLKCSCGFHAKKVCCFSFFSPFQKYFPYF